MDPLDISFAFGLVIGIFIGFLIVLATASVMQLRENKETGTLLLGDQLRIIKRVHMVSNGEYPGAAVAKHKDVLQWLNDGEWIDVNADDDPSKIPGSGTNGSCK